MSNKVSSGSVSIVVVRHFVPAPHKSVTVNYKCEMSKSPSRTGCWLMEAACRIIGPLELELPAFGVTHLLDNRADRRTPRILTDEDEKSWAEEAGWIECAG